MRLAIYDQINQRMQHALKLTCFLIGWSAVLFYAGTLQGAADSPPVLQPPVSQFSACDLIHPVFAPQAMVVSTEAHATDVGLAILQQGGNAVDAAVAMGFTLAVTFPEAGNLGGGGFMLIDLPDQKETVAIDFRETAPQKAHRDLYLDEHGQVDQERAQFSHQSVGIPGTVAGLLLAHTKYGRLTRQEVIKPIQLAEQGFIVSPALAHSLHKAHAQLARWPSSQAIFFTSANTPYLAGEWLIQRDLAKSLKQISEQGAYAFYEGTTAEQFVADMEAHEGLITRADLKGYTAILRQPLQGHYRDYQIVTMPPPSSGGAHLIQLLNILEHFPIEKLGHNSAATIHYLAEAMKMAYADRSEYLGDPDHVRIPLEGLLAKSYANQRMQEIDPNRARSATQIHPGHPNAHPHSPNSIQPSTPHSIESPQTTHYSVVDPAGYAVAVTYTLNFAYGSGIVAAGTGILLNNQMADFSAKPGIPNTYGLIGGTANAIAPGKRPLSSMTPTFVFKNEQLFLITGSPGGSRIITTVLQIILNVIDHTMNIAEATIAPRIHHQWLPDTLFMEKGISVDTQQLLIAKGHSLRLQDAMGSTQSILRCAMGWCGAADPRYGEPKVAGY